MFTIGSDPEVFLKKEIDGLEEYFPSIGIVEGDKYNPTPVGDDGRSILADNVMLEFNTIPAYNKEDFIEEHLDFLNYIGKDMEMEYCTISKESFVKFHPRFLEEEEAQEFGCEPDYNAYTLKQNKAPDAKTPYRSAAGHIHIGYKGHNQKTNLELIKLLDLTLGVTSVLDDSDRQRRSMYGKAGTYRMKDFGFEYRVLSNYWIFDRENLSKVYDGVVKAFELHESGFKINKELETRIINCINNYNEIEAKLLIKETEQICVD